MSSTLAYIPKFQPTLPVRGVTSKLSHTCQKSRISTHTPRAGSDPFHHARFHGAVRFQPTLPVRGVTGADLAIEATVTDFNPHSPCGE